jgi:Domain of unknown function (DUF4384)
MRDKQRSEPAEFDVYICSADGPDAEMPSTVAAYLTRTGFHVRMGGGLSTEGRDGSSLASIDDIPDFILLLTPATLTALADAEHTVRAEVVRALAAGRNVVRVFDSTADVRIAADNVPGIAALADQQSVTYNPDRLAESLSILGHALSSEPAVADRHLMRRTRRWFIFAALFVIAGFSLQTVPMVIRAWKRPKPLPPVAPFVLYWTAFAERADTGGPAEFELQPGVTVSGGDMIRVAFSPSADGFAYVIGKDARGRVSVLFPTGTMKGASRVRAGQAYSAPVDSDWLTIDPEVGLAAIYVFASYDPLQNLEELVEEPETPTNLGARRELVDQTISGLLDGRHYQYGRRIMIRTTQYIDQSLSPAGGPASFSALRPAGAALTHPARVQPGLVSALAEIKVTFVPPPR